MSAASRRWPPIVAAIIGAVLVFLVLPNPLSVPQTNPSASAEYAPVPGKQEEAQSANFSQTNTASSSGIGSGGEGIGALPGIPPPKLPEFKPRQKNCVGNPPRQTEDPLSPPCVPFFEGKNGGNSYQGVTKDDIVVIFYNDRCCDQDVNMNAPWKPSDEGSCTYAWECENVVRTVKAHLRFFTRRYQTYGRTVRLIAQRSSGNVGGACNTRESDAKTALETFKPFAAISTVQGDADCYNRIFAERKVPVFGLNEENPQELYDRFRPYAFGFMPTQEVQTAFSASFLCQKIIGGKARFANDDALRGDDRILGFIHPDGDSRGTELRVQAGLLVKELKSQCGFTFPYDRKFTATAQGAGVREAGGIISDFKRAGVTTIVCYCIGIPTEGTVPAMQKAASGLNYSPEWYFDSASYMERGIWLRQYGGQDQAMFGSTYLWRAPAFREQFHYQAYLQEEPGSEANAFWSYRIYHLFLNLFQGIQAAGPDLTPATVEQGMFTFNYTDLGNPWVPAGGYGAYSPNAISNYTFIDTGMGWWWDPTGNPPGSSGEKGCVRVVRQGVRSYKGSWPKGDSDMFVDDAPCTQDLYKIADPSTSTSF